MRKTHTEAKVKFWGSMRLDQKLGFNRRIETENDARFEKAMDEGLDPDDASFASSMSLSAEEWDDMVNVPGLWESVKSYASNKVKFTMAHLMKEKSDEMDVDEGNAPSPKKRRAKDDSDEEEDSRKSKRSILYLSPNDEQEFSADGGLRKVPMIFTMTEGRTMFPLRWCVEHIWQWMLRNIEKLPTKTERDFDEEEMKMTTFVILDVGKILSGDVDVRYRDEMAFLTGGSRPRDYGEFMSAKDNMIALQKTREDTKKGQSFNSDWYVAHFAGYLSRPEIGDPALFKFWIEMEEDDRVVRRRTQMVYNEKEAKDAWRAMMNSVKVGRHLVAATPGGSGMGFASLSTSGTGAKPPTAPRSFREGRRPSKDHSDEICLICCKLGHSAKQHDRNVHGSKLAGTGRPCFTKRMGSDFVRADKPNQHVCLNWNSSGSQTACNHPQSRVHICTFCGAVDHWALSGSCAAVVIPSKL